MGFQELAEQSAVYARRIMDLEKQRAELLAALNDACAMIENYAHHQFHPEKLRYGQAMESFRYNADLILEEARAAIAKVRGE